MESFKFLIPDESSGVTVKNISTLRKIEEQLREVFGKFNYQETIMPTFEFMDLYRDILKNNNNEQTYNFINDKGENITLRWDFTIPIARYYVSQNKKNNEIARYSYFGKVFRRPKKLTGKMSEYNQAGVELINVSAIEGEKEILGILTETLPNLELKRLKIELGSSLFFNRIFELTGKKQELIDILAKKNISDMRKFVEKNNFDEKIAILLLKLPRLCGRVSILNNIIKTINDEILLKSLNELKQLYDIISLKNKDYEVIFDLSMVPSMEYYTGCIFKVYSEYAPDPIIQGGRYDKLLEEFGKNVPAIGFAYYLDGIVKAGKKERENNVEDSYN